MGLERVLGWAELVAEVAEEAARLHVLGLHVVLDGGQVGRCVVTICMVAADTAGLKGQ